FGIIIADAARGTLMGNRGGRLHDDERRLGPRRWASKAWICCELAFKGWHRQVMGNGYTELFFLDEVTALAAGHRPCFECRRADALAFAEAFGRGIGAETPPRAPGMDVILHGERLSGQEKRRHRRAAVGLPDGIMIAMGDTALALRQ